MHDINVSRHESCVVHPRLIYAVIRTHLSNDINRGGPAPVRGHGFERQDRGGGAPHDDAPRLVYADWLLDRGDPRGELIQIQCSPRRYALAERIHALLDEHGAAWTGVPHDPRVRWVF